MNEEAASTFNPDFPHVDTSFLGCWSGRSLSSASPPE